MCTHHILQITKGKYFFFSAKRTVSNLFRIAYLFNFLSDLQNSIKQLVTQNDFFCRNEKSDADENNGAIAVLILSSKYFLFFFFF